MFESSSLLQNQAARLRLNIRGGLRQTRNAFDRSHRFGGQNTPPWSQEARYTSDGDLQHRPTSLTSGSDILDLQQSLADALHYYSTSTDQDDNGCCPSNQPLRTSLKRSDGQTTLFMPASSNDGLGVKVCLMYYCDLSIAIRPTASHNLDHHFGRIRLTFPQKPFLLEWQRIFCS